MREKDPVMAEARALAAVVLARPGTDSSSTCPPAARAVSKVTRRFSCPTTRDPNTEAMVFTTWAERSRSAGVIAALRGEKRSEEHTSELQSRGQLVCRILLESKRFSQ